MQDVCIEGEGCAEEDLDILDMDSRASTDGCSSLYVGDIEIPIEEIVASIHSFEHRDLAVEQKDPGSTFTSPLELHEVDSTDDEEEVYSHEPSHLVGSLNMGEKKINKSLHILHNTHVSLSDLCLRATSLEDSSFLEAMENIQRVMYTIQSNFLIHDFGERSLL